MTKIEENAGAPRDHDAIERLNRAAQDTGLQLCFGCEENRLHTEVGGMRGAIGRDVGDGVPRRSRRIVPSVAAVPGPDVYRGLLRPQQEPLGQVVLDGGLREPEQGAQVPGARTNREGGRSGPPGSAAR